MHAYPNKKGWIEIEAKLFEDRIEITISDSGVGITDITRALEPFYTTKPLEERSGMGFTVMESFMDEMEVCENAGGGLKVRLVKNFEKKSKLAVGE